MLPGTNKAALPQRGPHHALYSTDAPKNAVTSTSSAICSSSDAPSWAILDRASQIFTAGQHLIDLYPQPALPERSRASAMTGAAAAVERAGTDTLPADFYQILATITSPASDSAGGGADGASAH
jgi:hypothetical protein